MAEEEDQGDKTEAPTPRRRQQVSEEGGVARSNDLVAASMLLGVLFILQSYGNSLVGALRLMMERMLRMDGIDLGISAFSTGTLSQLWTVGVAVLPILVGVAIIAILANVVQVGFRFNFEKLQPNFERLNPIGGLGKLFSGSGGVRLLMGVLKMSLVGAVAYSAAHNRLGEILASAQLTYQQVFQLGAQLVMAIGLRVGLLLLILAIIDYGYQKYQFEQSLKMSKQAIKQESKTTEGDPKIKQRRKQIALSIAQKTLKKTVPEADVVITNPTEFAIALKYDSATMRAPVVVAKGADLMAKRIREIAIENAIPILERKPLARALYVVCQVGQVIPEEFYSAIAQILAYVYELGRRKARA